MDEAESTRELVMRCWRSWQERDFDTFEACFAQEGIDFDTGTMRLRDRGSLRQMAERGPAWREVRLLESVFAADRAALLYTGIEDSTEEIWRVAELVTVRDGAIVAVQVVMTSTPPL